MTNEKLREGFETWADSELWNFKMTGPFNSVLANASWAAWQAAHQHNDFARRVREKIKVTIGYTEDDSFTQRGLLDALAMCDEELGNG